MALSGIGFAMLVSLRDPLRDQLLFTRFAEGTLFGGLALVLCAIPSYERTVLRRLAFVPLLGALALSLALVLLGRGPAGSDARVNLVAQPMELIRLLLVLFLAGYFAARWALLRELDERPLGDAWTLRMLKLPRLHHVLPDAIGVAASVLLFFVQRDLGPALLLLALFLSLYAVTRRGVGLALAGLAAVFGAFAISHAIGFPRTVSLRTAMWLFPLYMLAINIFVIPIAVGGSCAAHKGASTPTRSCSRYRWPSSTPVLPCSRSSADCRRRPAW